MTTILSVFLTRLIGGYGVLLGVVGPQVVAGTWRRVSLFTIAGLAVVALATEAPTAPCVATIASALVVERLLAFDVRIPGSAIWLAAPAPAWLLWANEPAFGVHSAASAIAIGGTLGAMLLGHSYLVARGLSFEPLKRMAWILFGILVLRAVSVVPAFFGPMEMMDMVFLSMRASLGLLLPLVLGWMVIECVKIESNQSATGILYAMTVLVAVFGELVAVYLRLARGIAA